MDYTGYGILQARILEWAAFPYQPFLILLDKFVLITAKEVNEGTSVSLLWTPCEAAHSTGLHRLLDIKGAQQAEQNNTFFKKYRIYCGQYLKKI